MIRQMVGMAALAATLAACGTNPQERTGGGAAAGAATGATVGLVGGPVGVLAGAAIGAGAGAVTGATTSARDVNLGRPLWDNPEVRTPLDRSHRTAQNTPRNRQPRATTEQDRAYMGGGMVGYPEGTSGSATSGANPPMGSGAASGGMGTRDSAMPRNDGMMHNDSMGTAPMRGTPPGMSGSGGATTGRN